MDEIMRLEKNLLLIRRAIGWSAERLGYEIGVTRQTINNIENVNTKNHLSKTQYIAIRSVLDAEIQKKPEDTKMVKVLLDMLIDNPDKYPEKEVNELISKANLISPSILAGTASRKTVSEEWIRIASTIAGGVAITMLSNPVFMKSIGTWLVKLTSKKR